VRIVSLLPSATEIVFALGRGDDVVGVTFECDYPPEARTRRVVSTSALPEGLTPAQIDAVVTERIAAGVDLYRLDRDALADLDADLVLTQDLCAVCAVDVSEVDDALEYLGCSAAVLTLDPRSVPEVLTSIITVGEHVDALDAAQSLTNALHDRLAALDRVLADAPRPTVLVLEWTDPPFTAGHWIPDLVVAGGGTAVLADPGHDSRRVDWDVVRTAPADVVVIAPCGYHLDASADLGRALLDRGAVPGGAAVWAVDADSYFVRPGPRVVDGAVILAGILHPDLVGAPDPATALRLRGSP
jgi:iron complex transport system substrate-binding protein